MGHLPVRGAAVRELGLPLPPERMPLLRGGRPLKRWRYVGVYHPDVMLCVGEAWVAGLPRRWWAVALPDGTLVEPARFRRTSMVCEPGRVLVASGVGLIDLKLEEGAGIEVVSPHAGSYIWTRKQAGLQVRGQVAVRGRRWTIDDAVGFIDESAGYHGRHTEWRWSAGIGVARDGERVAWNLVDGIHDAPEASERTVWIEGEPREVGPQEFAADLSSVGGLQFTPWSVREENTNRLLVRSRYRQPFGTFTGELPGGPALDSGRGVMEWHDAYW